MKFKNKNFPIKDFGIKIIKRDKGTGYHIPEGLFLAMGQNNKRLERYKNEVIETARICPTILDIFSLKIPKYMKKPL